MDMVNVIITGIIPKVSNRVMVQQESRVRKSLLNARVNLIFYFLTLALSFFSRRIFLDTLGANFVGLTGTLQNLLGFLNLAELGIGSAIGYVLYKPLFDHDEVKINEIISVFGYLYRWIGWIILIAGCILACFLPLIFPNTEFDLALIFFAYFSFLVSSLIGYFANYKQTLLGADQKNYVVTAYFQTASLIKTIIQMALAYYTGNYYIWVAIELLFGVIYSCILNWKINQVYPWLKLEVRQGKLLFKKYPEVMEYTKQLFVHRISAFVQFQISPFLVYLFVSLHTVALYGNYTLVIDKINLLLYNMLGGVSAGVGNLITEGNSSKILQVFWELFAIRFLIVGIAIFGLYQLVPPFILLWLGEKYILADWVLFLLVVNFFIAISRGTIDPFLYGYGLFYDTWAPITESAIYVTVALVGGYCWGLTGVILGSTVSLFLIICLWKPYFLFTKGFNRKLSLYWLGWIKYTLTLAGAIILCTLISDEFIYIRPVTWRGFMLYSLLIMLLFSTIYTVILWLVSKSLRSVLGRLLFNYIQRNDT